MSDEHVHDWLDARDGLEPEHPTLAECVADQGATWEEIEEGERLAQEADDG